MPLPQDSAAQHDQYHVAGYSGTGYLTNFDSQTNSDYFELKSTCRTGCMKCGSATAIADSATKDTNTGLMQYDRQRHVRAIEHVHAPTGRDCLTSRAASTRSASAKDWGFYDVDYLEFGHSRRPRFCRSRRN